LVAVVVAGGPAARRLPDQPLHILHVGLILDQLQLVTGVLTTST
jgi:hypothetical protein